MTKNIIKIITTVLFGIILSTPYAFADSGDFFIRGNIGMKNLSSIKNYKSDDTLVWGGGIGYNIMENLRIDLSFDNLGLIIFKDAKTEITVKPKMLTCNMFVDLFDISLLKVFIGVGAGVTQTSATILKYLDKSNSEKKETSPTYIGYVGISTKISQSLNIELMYSYNGINLDNLYSLSDKIKNSNVNLGIRIDI